MREIKFRGKRISDGKWVYGDLVHSQRLFDEHGNVPKENECIISSIQTIETDDDIVPETLGQFTGLLDKNGREIYEGDKCIEREELRNPRTREPYKKPRYITREGVIVFHEGSFDFKSERYQGQIRCFASTPRCSGIEIEIIGNIHEGTK